MRSFSRRYSVLTQQILNLYTGIQGNELVISITYPVPEILRGINLEL